MPRLVDPRVYHVDLGPTVTLRTCVRLSRTGGLVHCLSLEKHLEQTKTSAPDDLLVAKAENFCKTCGERQDSRITILPLPTVTAVDLNVMQPQICFKCGRADLFYFELSVSSSQSISWDAAELLLDPSRTRVMLTSPSPEAKPSTYQDYLDLTRT